MAFIHETCGNIVLIHARNGQLCSADACDVKHAMSATHCMHESLPPKLQQKNVAVSTSARSLQSSQAAVPCKVGIDQTAGTGGAIVKRRLPGVSLTSKKFKLAFFCNC